MKQETEVCATSCSSFLHKHKQTVFQDTALKQFQSAVSWPGRRWRCSGKLQQIQAAACGLTSRHPVVKTYFSQLKLPHLGANIFWGQMLNIFLGCSSGWAGWWWPWLDCHIAMQAGVLCLPPPVCTQLTLATWPLGPARPSLVLCQILDNPSLVRNMYYYSFNS